MAKVVLKNVSKYYGNVVGVEDVNLEINDKEFCVIVGPSGCGKSTTLRLIAGLEEVSKGSIYIDDVCVNNVPPKDRDIAMVFQNYALYPHMKVYDNLAFGLRLRGYTKSEIDERVHEAAKLLEIESLLDRYPKQLSGGQRQRVAVGRAIVRKPKVFLFDEPLSNLDAKLRVQMRAELKKLHEKLQTTVVYVTHDQVEAMTMGDKICVMKDGRVHQVDSPDKLYNEPVNIFVAGFIGSPPMNFVKVKIITYDEVIWLDEGSFKIKLPEKFVDIVKPYINQELTLGIRPEDIYDKVFYQIGPIDGNTFSAVVDLVEPIGAEKYLHLTTGRNTLIARVEPYNTSKVGQVIDLVVNLDKIHLFDQSGKALF